jgi:hypothetical protein
VGGRNGGLESETENAKSDAKGDPTLAWSLLARERPLCSRSHTREPHARARARARARRTNFKRHWQKRSEEKLAIASRRANDGRFLMDVARPSRTESRRTLQAISRLVKPTTIDQRSETYENYSRSHPLCVHMHSPFALISGIGVNTRSRDSSERETPARSHRMTRTRNPQPISPIDY